MTNSNTKTKTIEKEKVVAETLNGRFAMIGLIAAVGAYLTTGQIIPGFEIGRAHVRTPVTS